MTTKINTLETIPQINSQNIDPLLAHHLMVEDYVDSINGAIKPEGQKAHTDEQLSDLRRTIVGFSILHDIDLEETAQKLDTEVGQLVEDLEKDQVLTELTNKYKDAALAEPMQKIDTVELPTMTGDEALRTFERLGFAEIRRKGSHATLEKVTEDGEAIRFPVPVGHAGDIHPGLLRSIIRKQAKVTLQDFVDAM
jgi:predicted RNA binding protein YcfA (HicA-like mRNA interferase family)